MRALTNKRHGNLIKSFFQRRTAAGGQIKLRAWKLRRCLVETLELLSDARRNDADGEKSLAHQRKIIDGLDRQGRDDLDALLFLEYVEEMQDQYELTETVKSSGS
jgi:hypothetical protein